MADPISHGQMMNYLVRNSEDKKRMREYFETNQITTASNINRPEGAEVRQIFEDFNFRNPLADGGRTGFKRGTPPGGSRPRTDLELENLTRKEQMKETGKVSKAVSGFKNLPGYDNITYSDFKNKKTGQIIRKYGVRVRVQDKNVQKIGTTGAKYRNIDTLEEAIALRDEFRKENPANIKPRDPTKDYISKDERRKFEKLKQGRMIKFGADKGYVVHHMLPLAGREDVTTSDLAVISDRMNAELAQFDKPMNKLVNEAYALDYSKTESLKRLDEINKELNGYLKTAVKKLGPEYKGLIGFNKLTPVLDTFDEKGNQVFFIERKGIDYKKSIGGKKTGTPVRDIKTSEIQKMVSEAPTTDIALVKEKMAQDLGKLGCPNVKFALGGRVKFNQGSACVIKGREKLDSILKKAGRASPQDQVLAQGILKAGQGLKNAFALRGLLGPAAIAFTTLTEGGIVGYDMLSQGKTLKEAMGDSVFNLMLGDDYKFNNDFMSAGGTFDERLDKLRFNPQQKQLINNFRSYVREADALGQAQIDVDKAQLRVKGSPVQDIIKDGPPSVLGKQFTRFVKPPTGKEKETREADLAAAIAAKEAADQSFQTRVQDSDFAKRMQSGMTEGADLMSKAIDLARLQQLSSVDQNIFGKAFEGDIAKEARRDEILKLLPTALNFAGGGIAKQAGDPSGKPPEKGPTSQGLLDILKRANKT